MFKKLFKRRKGDDADVVKAGDTPGAAVDVGEGLAYFSSDKNGVCPACGGELENRTCIIHLASMNDEREIQTDKIRFCSDCPSVVLKTPSLHAIVKEEKMRGALPIGIMMSEDDEIQAFSSYDGVDLNMDEPNNPEMMAVLSRLMGARAGGGTGDGMSRKGMTDAEKRRKREKRKQASRARKKNRKR